MSKPNQDMWAQWILNRRFGGDSNLMKAVLDNFLYPVRDKVLSHARLAEGETLLDVGCGDGLIGFGALEKLTAGKVIFSDISQDLLDHTQALVHEMKLSNCCEFLCASADDLSAIPDGSIDVVTTRSVLIYVSDKQRAFNEFFRVLNPEGRLSIYEPINRFGWPPPPHVFAGYDVTPIIEIADKVKALYRRLQPPDEDPMVDFDERDLIAMAEQAGFTEVHLELEAEIKPPEPIGWDAYFRSAPNPKVPTLEEAVEETLSSAEAEQFMTHLRPLVEARQGTIRSAQAYVWAAKRILSREID